MAIGGFIMKGVGPSSTIENLVLHGLSAVPITVTPDPNYTIYAKAQDAKIYATDTSTFREPTDGA